MSLRNARAALQSPPAPRRRRSRDAGAARSRSLSPRRPAALDARAITPPSRARASLQNAGRLSLRAHDRRGGGLACRSLLYEGGEEHRRASACSISSAGPIRRSSGATCSRAFYGHLLVAGNAYLEAVAIDGTRARAACAAARPHEGRSPGRDGWPEAYEYTVDGRIVRFAGRRAEGVRADPASEAVPSRSTTITACRRIEAAAAAIDIHNAAGAWNKALLDNAARPSGALVYTGRAGAQPDRGAVRAAESRARADLPGRRATPAGRCCSKAASTGSR